MLGDLNVDVFCHFVVCAVVELRFSNSSRYKRSQLASNKEWEIKISRYGVDVVTSLPSKSGQHDMNKRHRLTLIL